MLANDLAKQLLPNAILIAGMRSSCDIAAFSVC